MLAYLASRFQDLGIQRLAKVALMLIGLIIAAASFQKSLAQKFTRLVCRLGLVFVG